MKGYAEAMFHLWFGYLVGVFFGVAVSWAYFASGGSQRVVNFSVLAIWALAVVYNIAYYLARKKDRSSAEG